ncbi:MAG: hypothetical protein H6774_01740 [Pseudomonadales bacterium]|nr:hypothetical protein [Pseudomonadales bacterium]
MSAKNNKEEQNSTELENVSLRDRVKFYEDKIVARATRIVIVVGCDDGRVGVSGKLEKDGKLLLYVPQIGGGAPTEQTMQAIMRQIRILNTRATLEILLTQHGNSAERLDHTDAATCGLRGVFKQHSQALLDLGQKLRDQNSITYDLMTNFQLKEEVATIANSIGIPPALVYVAAMRNFSGNWRKNLQHVHTVAQTWTFDEGIAIHTGYFDHTDGAIYHAENVETVLHNQTLQSDHSENMDYQDPACAVISVGKRAIVLHDGYIDPIKVGVGAIDNDFSACALTIGGLMGALGEVWYAMNNHIHPHGQNFANLSKLLFVCDGDEEVEMVKNALSSDEFKQTMLAAYQGAEVKIVSLAKGEEYDLELDK